jgi:O-antigen ligase
LTDAAVADGVRPTIARHLTSALLVTSLTLACVAGLVGPYVAIFAVVVSVVAAFDPERLAVALRDWTVRLFFFAFALFAVAFAATMRSPGDLLALFDFAVLLLSVPAYALLTRSAGPGAVRRISWLALAGAAIGLVFGLFEVHVLQVARATGGFSSIFYSDLGVMLGFLAAGGLFAPGASTRRWLLALGPMLGAAMMYVGGGRGALLVYAALSILFIAVAVIVWRREWKKVVAAISIAVTSLLLPSLVFDPSRQLGVADLAQEAAEEGVTSDESTNHRLQFYQAGLKAFADAPIAGHGWWRRVTAAIPYMDEAAASYETDFSVAHLHNDLINFGSAAGILGIAAYVMILLAPIAGLLGSPRDGQFAARTFGVLALSVGFLVMGLTDSMFVYGLPKTFFVFVSVILIALCRDREAGLR